jgi:hypothetical protein
MSIFSPLACQGFAYLSEIFYTNRFCSKTKAVLSIHSLLHSDWLLSPQRAVLRPEEMSQPSLLPESELILPTITQPFPF